MIHTRLGGGVALLLISASLSSACAARYERETHADLRAAARRISSLDETRAPLPDGSLASYVRYAAAESPGLRAAYDRWRAAALRIDPARRPPDPTVMYGFYFGPNMHRASVSQELPWPARLGAAADAQSMRALAAQRRFEAQLLAVRMEVARAYWRLWEVRASRSVQREQQALLGALSEAVRGRVEVGQATLADLAQIDLARSRLDDADQRLAEEERAREAALRAVIGAPAGAAMATTEAPPEPVLPAEDTAALAAEAREHPYVRAFLAMSEASGAEARAVEAERFPRLRVSVEAMIDHERGSGAQSPMEGVIASVGLSIPLWQDAYASAQRAAEADADADRADAQAAGDAAVAELEQALSSVRDSHRRTRLYEGTLLPQAQSAYESVIGAYVTGRGSIAQTSLAQRDLLELALELVRARAEHGAAWARLDRAVGRAVRRGPAHD